MKRISASDASSLAFFAECNITPESEFWAKSYERMSPEAKAIADGLIGRETSPEAKRSADGLKEWAINKNKPDTRCSRCGKEYRKYSIHKHRCKP